MLQPKRSLFFVTCLTVLSMVLSACGPRLSTAPSDMASQEAMIDLPALVVEYDESGEASIFGRSVSELGDILGADLSALSLGADTVEALAANNIQTIQIDKQPGGLRIFVNGSALPTIVWDADALASLGTTLDAFGVEGISGLLPVLTTLGMGLTLKLPGASDSSLAAPSSDILDMETATGIMSAAAGTPSGLNATVAYNPDGTFQLSGLELFMGMVPADALTALELSPEMLQDFEEQGIQEMGVRLSNGGLLVSVNGETLPYMQWSNVNELISMIDLIGALTGNDGLAQVSGMLPTVAPLLGMGLSLNMVFSSN